jgi:hypothetical protein
MLHRYRCLAPGLILWLVSGCSGGGGPSYSEVSIATPPADNIKVSSSLPLAVTVLDKSGVAVPNATVSWSSSDTAVLTVSPGGVVSAVAAGTASVTASAGGRSDTVTLRSAQARSLRIAAPTYAVRPGDSVQLRLLAKDSTDVDLLTSATWTSAQPAIATISAAGLVTGVAHGVAEIRVSSLPDGATDDRILISVQEPVRDKIAFLSARGPFVLGQRMSGIYLMNVDGSDQQQLFESEVDNCGSVANNPCFREWGKPSWNPDGMRLATSSIRTYAIERLGPMIFLCATGAQPSCQRLEPFPARRHWLYAHVFDGPLIGSSPAWSADGRRLVFAHETWDVASHTFAPLPVFADEPVWAPDGVRIAFVSGSNILVMNSDGSGQVNLTNGVGAHNITPQWSPDGTRIAFVSDREGNNEIYVMGADGSGLLNLTAHPGNDASPSWSPDGLKIAFQTDRDGNHEIYSMNADGSAAVNLTNDPVEDTTPAWSP